MNRKGFTLFTALVSFVLIVLAAILVQAMVASEGNTVDILADVSEQQEMQAIADLARADALHLFNFGMRYSIEEWLTDDKEPKDDVPDNSYLLDPGNMSWNGIVDDFASSNFGGSGSENIKFAQRTAIHLQSILSTAPDVRGYRVDLLTAPQQKNSSLALQESLTDATIASTDAGDFFKVIQCDSGEFRNCQGTFYVNLNLKYLTDEKFEVFPQIQVSKPTTMRALREAVLPRENFQMFVPLRVFKALAGGRQMAVEAGGIKGLYSGPFKQELNEIEKQLDPSGSNCNENSGKANEMGNTLKASAAALIEERGDELAQAIGALDSGSDFHIAEDFTGHVLKKINVLIDKPEKDEGGKHLYCVELSSFEAYAVFVEENPNYMVIDKTDGQMYGVRFRQSLN
ncbi:MAG: hypothetical protein V1494_00110 [Candidatus Diapherotrites archaeon]